MDAMKRTSSGSALNCTVPSLYPVVKSLSLSRSKVLQSDEAGGPSAGQKVDCLNKLDDGGEKEMYLVLLHNNTESYINTSLEFPVLVSVGV